MILGKHCESKAGVIWLIRTRRIQGDAEHDRNHHREKHDENDGQHQDEMDQKRPDTAG